MNISHPILESPVSTFLTFLTREPNSHESKPD
jgi:hypothetical protein